MKSLLHALNDGRLIELPDNDKTMALEYLAALLEAIPDIHFGDEGIAGRAANALADPINEPSRDDKTGA